MATFHDRDLPSGDAGDGPDPEADEGEALEAEIELADRSRASESFGTTALEQEQGESLDQRLAEERPDRSSDDRYLSIEDAAAPDEEKQLVGRATLEHDPLMAPEEAALQVRDHAPGAVDHPEER